MLDVLTMGLKALAVVCVCLSTVPVFAGLHQFISVTFSFFFTHFDGCAPHVPRISIIVAAWNEDAVVNCRSPSLSGVIAIRTGLSSSKLIVT
ncbi:MAG: hypothetical protein ACI9OJ_005680 [Myxococcota bacterium]|jgi:hypothetical protein